MYKSVEDSLGEAATLLASFEAVAVRVKSGPNPPPLQMPTLLRFHAKNLDQYVKRLEKL